MKELDDKNKQLNDEQANQVSGGSGSANTRFFPTDDIAEAVKEVAQALGPKKADYK